MEENDNVEDVAFLVQTMMRSRKGPALLVDPGAHGDRCSDGWLQEYNLAAREAGQPEARVIKLEKPVTVGGVGKKAQTATEQVIAQVGINGRTDEYRAPMLKKSPIPALLGIPSLRRRRALLDCHNGRLFLIGPGGYQLRLSPGSRDIGLEESHSGHLMLPCDDWPSKAKTGGSSSRSPTPQ